MARHTGESRTMESAMTLREFNAQGGLTAMLVAPNSAYVSRLLGMDQRTVTLLAQRKELPATKLGSS
ncbi:hypothetical protein [Atopobium sp. oral taxon 810]|uniref:hypothetical protein n=1 Tax=Atopobium sp. oral taxon 810 TaxID=712158 RepID=UPI0012EB357F|nr:hypothetical protein [Atopobium sp. oral taxon 810]